MFKKSLVVGCSISLLTLAGWYLSKPNEILIVKAEQNIVGLSASTPSPKQLRARRQAAKCEQTKSESFVEKPIRVIKPSVSKYNSLSQAFGIPGELLSAARRGDVSAGLTLFKGISNCYPISLSEAKLNSFTPTAQCSEISKDMYRNRFALLEDLAKTGDAAAQTMYALQGSAVGDIQRRSKDPFEVQQGKNLMEKVENFAQRSAREGSKDSIQFLITAYRDGLFGTPDPGKSYAYMVAMNKYFPNEVPLAIVKAAQLSVQPVEKLAGEPKTIHCVTEVEGSQVTNPFAH